MANGERGDHLWAASLGLPATGGSASVEGIFAFTNPGTVPDVGTHSFPVTFTPTSDNYSTASGSVSVTVVPATPVVTTWPTASGSPMGSSSRPPSLQAVAHR